MKIYISIFVMISFIGFSQQNLIPNGSFEKMNMGLWDMIVDGQYIYDPEWEQGKIITTHMAHNLEFSPDSFVKCWWARGRRFRN